MQIVRIVFRDSYTSARVVCASVYGMSARGFKWDEWLDLLASFFVLEIRREGRGVSISHHVNIINCYLLVVVILH